MSYILTNPIFTAKVVAYERLAYNPKVWFKEYELFPDRYSLKEWMQRQNKDCYNIRNVEIYDVLIDITKHEAATLPERLCKGCGKQIDGDGQGTIVEGEYYCSFDCFCHHKEESLSKPTCSKCGRDATNITYYQKDNKLYCSVCVYDLLKSQKDAENMTVEDALQKNGFSIISTSKETSNDNSP